jgi:hypothetical protein
MKKLVPILLMFLGATGAFAQAAKDGVTVSTDPAKAAAVEQHAQQLKARAAQQQVQTATTDKSSKAASKSKSKKKTTRAKPTATK